MKLTVIAEPDLMPPAFAEGLSDWSRGDGTPDSPTYETGASARLAAGDRDFGACLELRKTEAVQRLRYMGEVPLRRGGYIEIAARLKAMRGPLPGARIAAWPGGAHGRGVAGLPTAAAAVALPAHGAVVALAAVIGPEAAPGVDMVWDGRALYAHVGVDLVGPDGGVVRIAAVEVRDVTTRFAPGGRRLPGF
jgi:hypothetical protein